MPRPKSPNPRDQQVNMRLTVAELEEARTMAAELGVGHTEALRDYGLKGMRSAVTRQRRRSGPSAPDPSTGASGA